MNDEQFSENEINNSSDDGQQKDSDEDDVQIIDTTAKPAKNKSKLRH